MNHKPSASREVIQAIAVTAELMGTDLSEAAARVFACELRVFLEDQVLEALTRCRREVRGRLTLADVIGRIDDGRPGAEEAWALVPRSENRSVVWTTEMAEAAGPAFRLLHEGDHVAARMVFKERYTAAVQAARAAGTPPRWYASLGYDPKEREIVLAEAVQQGRLSYDYAVQLWPGLPLPDVLSQIDDGRPGAEEAWSLVPRSKDRSVVWTTEMAEAAGPAFRLLNEGNPVGARMAFKERYTAAVQAARAAGTPPRWYASLGYDPKEREIVLAEAVQQGRLSYDYAVQLWPGLPLPDQEPTEAIAQG